MQSIGTQVNFASRYWGANVPLFGALYRNAIIFLGFFGLCVLYVAPAKFQFGPIPINVFFPSILVIIGCMSLIGKRALTITPMDYFFGFWFCLAFLSHIFANEYLFRTLMFDSLATNLEFVVGITLTFRAFYALTSLDLKIATKMFICCSLLTCGGIATLGIVQRFGPGKSAALKIGMMLSKVPQQVQAGIQLGRPTAIYDNPNMLGYVACIFAVFVLAWGLQDVRKLKPAKTIGMMVMLGVAIFCTMAVQSRQNAALLVLTPIAVGIVIRLYAKDSRNTVILGFMVGIAMFGAVSFVTLSKSTYLVSLTHKNISDDQSFHARSYELGRVKNVSGDISPLGTGESAANLTNSSIVAGYSYYRLPNIDSEWGNIYSGFGVWGPLLLIFLYLINGRIVRDIWKETSPEGRMMALMALFLLVFNLILTLTAVRVAKYDTGLFTFQILGVAAAWRNARIEKGIVAQRTSAVLS